MNYVNENIVKPGTRVKFKKEYSNMNGVVKAVWIGDGSILYMIAYFRDGTFCDPYVPREMFDIVDDNELPVGFQLKK